MAKGKSSASSATRKKHAKKAAARTGQDDLSDDDSHAAGSSNPQPKSQSHQKLQRGQKKNKKDKKDRFAPKVKSYVPPPAPPKGAPDPVDLYLGGGNDVDPALLVVLKRFMKKDESTLAKGIEGLQEWAFAVIEDERNDQDWKWEARKDELVRSMAVWAHHFERLASHPSKRLRLLTAQLHQLLTSPSSKTATETRQALTEPMWIEQTQYVGAWACSSFDTDRLVRTIAEKTWASLELDLVEYASTLLAHAESTLFSRAQDESSELDQSYIQVPALSLVADLWRKLPTPLPAESKVDFVRSRDLWQLLGSDSAPVRKATYDLLKSAVARNEDDLLSREDGLADVSKMVLEHCWRADTDWEAVIFFLRRYPDAWAIASSSQDERNGDAEQSDSDSGSDDENDEAADKVDDEAEGIVGAFKPASSIERFFRFMRDTCAGNAANYAVVLLLFSTIPAELLSPTREAAEAALDALWAAKDSRVLAPQRSRSQFVECVADCLVFFVRKIEAAAEEPSASRQVAATWLGKLWTYLLHKSTSSADFERFVTALGRLTKSDSGLSASIEGDLQSSLQQCFEPESRDRLSVLPEALAAFDQSESPAPVGQLGAKLRSGAADAALERLESGNDKPEAQIALLSFLTTVVGTSGAIENQRVDAAVQDKLPGLVLSGVPGSSSLLADQLKRQPNTAPALWATLFDPTPSVETLIMLYDVASGEGLSAHLPPIFLDETLSVIAAQVLSSEGGSASEEKLLQKVLSGPPLFTTAEMPFELVALVLHRLETLVSQVLTSHTAQEDHFRAPVVLLDTFVKIDERASYVARQIESADAVFVLAHGLASLELGLDDSSAVVKKARQVWSKIRVAGSSELELNMVARHREHIVDATYGLAVPEVIENSKHFTSDVTALAVSGDELRQIARPFEATPCPAYLSIIDPLVSSCKPSDARPVSSALFDSEGLSSLTRAIICVLDISARERKWALANTELVESLLLFRVLLGDQLDEPVLTTGLFDRRTADRQLVRTSRDAVDGLTSFLISSATRNLPDAWHNDAVSMLRKSEMPAGESSSIMTVVQHLYTGTGDLHARAFSRLLSRLLQYTDREEDALRWLAFAQSLPEGSIQSRAIIVASKDFLLENPRFTRYQNELASTAAGVSPAQANDKGMRILRTLIATAPEPDSPVIFLPQQRCIFLIQRVQAWLSSDEELDDDVHAVLAELFLHIAPIIQDMSGSHWDLMFDIIESNLEVASWDDESTLVAMYHSCVLLKTLSDLASTNRELRASISGKLEDSVKLVRKLLLSRPVGQASGLALQMITDVMLDLVRASAKKALEQEAAFAGLLPLLGDSALSVRKAFYALAQDWVHQHVDNLVVEAELDVEGKMTIELPGSLMSMMSQSPADAQKSPLRFLLSWLLAFEHFVKASPRIKSAYIEQLRNTEVVSSCLLPTLFSLIGIGGRRRIVDLAVWSVDSFELDLVEDDSAEAPLALLAAHVYYRTLQSVPSLVRSWLDGCRDKQLSMAVTSQTSRHFSPLLIEAELRHLRDPEDPAGKSLRDNEDFSVKVAAGANEVKAIYVVDEQNMEISIRLPSEYPLQVVEVKDVRKVGVTDAQWRAWILAVQQVITTQNGLIAEALSLFKRNVGLHFEGVEACAICYSVISVVDRTLPTKACRVCHNKFHAGCLYKWFMTSHGSSCPLCRSLF